MKKIRLENLAELYDSINELEKEDRQLAETAIHSMDSAYAPYSNYQVGAAVLLQNGEIIIGNNQENASFPLGICGERVAIFSAKSKFPKSAIQTVAIATYNKGDKDAMPAAPCGACRQTLFEYEFKDANPIRLVLVNKQGKAMVIPKAGDLLPFGFHAGFLTELNQKEK